MIDALGIVNFEDDTAAVEGLSKYRTVAAISFLGRYRIIDFVLSNMVNSGIDQIKVLVKNKPRSLIEHIGSGTQYNINSKSGSLNILYSDEPVLNNLYFTDIALLRQYEDTIKEANEDYVIIAPSNMIAKIDYQDVLEAHVQSGADITVVYKHVTDAKTHFLTCDELSILRDGRVAGKKTNRGRKDEADISMQTFVMHKLVLLELIDRASEVSALFTLRDFIEEELDQLNVQAYEYNGYLRCINSLKEYFDTSLELIDYGTARQLITGSWPIFTKTNDSSPAFFSAKAKVKHSLVANGCAVEGNLDNCILGRGAKVRKGATLKNVLLLPGAEIGENVHIENAVIDKDAKVQVVKELIGTPDSPVYVGRREIV